jgi:large subunit ribosomal protein L22
MPRAKTAPTGQSTAGARYLRISSTKLNQVAALIRNQHVDEARRILAFTPKAASGELSKVLESAIANAEHNFNLHADELFVKEVRTDEGPTLKRFRPRAQGRAYRIRKRTSHIGITLERRAPEAPQRDAQPADGAAGRRWRRPATGGTRGGRPGEQSGARGSRAKASREAKAATMAKAGAKAGKGDKRGS